MNWRNKLKGLQEIWQFDNRLSLVVFRLFFPSENLYVYRYKNIEFIEDHASGDANGAREVLTSQMYRRFLAEMSFSSPINVLDFGANNGGFPLLLKSERIKIKKVICVELNPSTFSRLRFNIERNFTDNFQCLNVAVCEKKRRIEINPNSQSTSASIYQKVSDDQEIVRLEGFSFDDIYLQTYANETVDLCKIDVEGAEFEIFNGENYRQLRNCRYLLIEIHHSAENLRQTVIDKIIDSGFIEKDGDNKTSSDLHYVHFFVNRSFPNSHQSIVD